LNWALLNGVPSVGLDVDRRALDDYATFLQQWAKGHRLPHKMQRYKKQHSEDRHFDFTVAPTRALLEAKPTPDVRTFHASAESGDTPVGKHSMIVTDLPYGIQHRARSGDANSATSVDELVESVSMRWADWLRTGGTVAASWNLKSLGRSEMIAVLARAQFNEVITGSFEHRVDRTITRDVVVARRAAPRPT
jgi:hypothetical protein